MSDQNDVTTEASELKLLQDRASLLGVPYHPSLGLSKLRARVAEAIEGTPIVETAAKSVAPAELRSKAMSAHQEKMFVLEQTRKACNKLVRVNISCMNINKKGYKGEIFTVSNNVVGTIKRFIPFDTVDGWHVPHMLLTMIEEKKFQTFYTVEDSKGREVKRSKLIKEFAIDYLAPLTPTEITDLARKQALANRID